MKRLIAVSVFVGLFLLSGMAQAKLTTIGTATYAGAQYNLIYMDDGPFGPVTWLDYTKNQDTWDNQVAWASGLSFSEADIQLALGVTTDIDWSTGWRLPLTDESKAKLGGGAGYAGPDANGYHDYWSGYNMVNSEMGYLFYEALGNKGYQGTSGNYEQSGWGLNNTCDFKSLQANEYWSGTSMGTSPDYNAWEFYFGRGYQNLNYKGVNFYALAVRPGEVSAVPIPGTLLLLGTGLAGLGAFRQGRRRRHWVIG